MWFRKFLNKIYDRDLSIQKRMFILITMLGITAFLVAFILGFILSENPSDLVTIGASMVLFSLIAILSIRYDKYELGANIIATVLSAVVFPLIFFSGGGLYGGAPVWATLCALFVCMVIPGRMKIFYLILQAVVCSLCYLGAYTGAVKVAPHNIPMQYQDSLASIILVNGMIGVMVSVALMLYRREFIKSEEQKKEIEELNRAQNRFFSNMSHEIRTPINTIIGFNEMILREKISDEVAEDAGHIRSASNVLLSLINDILDMSKIESGQLVPANVVYETGNMLSSIVGMLWLRAEEKGLEFHVEVDPKLPARLYGDEVRITQILINILTNAIKYTEQGYVRFEIQYEDIGSNRGIVTYTVSDSGIGIRKENLPHLFTAFRRVEEDRNRFIEGTGLGLSIVKQLTELMGGSVRVNSVYTKGSTFTVELPQERADDDVVGDIRIEERHLSNYRNEYRKSFEAPQARVLIVDDDPANILVEEKLLRDTYAQIDHASSGEEALMKTLKNRYHVIFMDHMMPEMDGIECHKRIREQTGGLSKDAKIVILTANAGNEDRVLYEREGFDGYLTKPVHGENLEKELARLLPEELVRYVDMDDHLHVEGKKVAGSVVKRVPVVITVDSVCDLPAELVHKYNIRVMPYFIKLGDATFSDGEEVLSNTLLFDYLSEDDRTIRSKSPVADDYVNFFAEELEHANRIIHLAMASKIYNSGCAAAREAAQTFENVTVVDSGLLTCGMGFVAMEAAELAAQGVSAGEIIKQIEESIRKTRVTFMVERIAYMEVAGQISKRMAHVFDAFMMHPMFNIRKGRYRFSKMYFGSRENVIRKYIRDALRLTSDADKDLLFVPYVGFSEEELAKIEREISSRAGFKKIIFQKASSAIAVNCGPGTLGICYRLK